MWVLVKSNHCPFDSACVRVCVCVCMCVCVKCEVWCIPCVRVNVRVCLFTCVGVCFTCACVILWSTCCILYQNACKQTARSRPLKMYRCSAGGEDVDLRSAPRIRRVCALSDGSAPGIWKGGQRAGSSVHTGCVRFRGVCAGW